MRRLVCPEGQIDIFPADVMTAIFSHPEQRATLPPLPIAETDEISTTRACEILGTNLDGIERLLKDRALKVMRKHIGRHSRRYISYASIVAFCDSLRIKYCIDDRRKPLRAGVRRYRDDELLPFPMSDTIGVSDVADAMRCADQTARKLCEQGTLVAYKLRPNGFWRISKSAFTQMRNDLDAHATAKRT